MYLHIRVFLLSSQARDSDYFAVFVFGQRAGVSSCVGLPLSWVASLHLKC